MGEMLSSHRYRSNSDRAVVAGSSVKNSSPKKASMASACLALFRGSVREPAPRDDLVVRPGDWTFVWTAALTSSVVNRRFLFRGSKNDATMAAFCAVSVFSGSMREERDSATFPLNSLTFGGSPSVGLR